MLATLSIASLVEAQQLNFKKVLFDLYLLRNASDIGLREIHSPRMKLYRTWSTWIEKQANQSDLEKLIVVLVGFGGD